jgi:AbrB family looped-hinge helix DNA binding protein
MELTTISSKYQIVIPQKIREQFELKPGDKLMFIPFGGSLRLVVVPPLEKARGMFKGLPGLQDDLREEVDEER